MRQVKGSLDVTSAHLPVPFQEFDDRQPVRVSQGREDLQGLHKIFLSPHTLLGGTILFRATTGICMQLSQSLEENCLHTEPLMSKIIDIAILAWEGLSRERNHPASLATFSPVHSASFPTVFQDRWIPVP